MDNERIRRQTRNCGSRVRLSSPSYFPSLPQLRRDIMASTDQATRDEGRGSVPRQKMSPSFASLSTLISAWRRDDRRKRDTVTGFNDRWYLRSLANKIANEDNQ